MRKHGIACIGAALCFGSLGAQQPGVVEPAHLHADLRAMSSTARLDSAAAALTGAAGARGAVLRGLVSLRRHELSDRLEDAQAAFNSFVDAAQRDSTAAWAFFGIGAAVDARPAVLHEAPGVLDRLLPPRRMAGGLGFEPRSRAQQSLLRALALEPSLAPAALLISDMAVVSMDEAELEIAAAALKGVTQTEGAAPEVWLALARVQNLMADASAANTAARLAASRGADLSLSLLSSASSLLSSPVTQERGSETYFEGTQALTEASAARYLRDMEPLFSARDRRELEGLSPGDTGAWIRRFWQARAALAGATVASTMGRHYRRLSETERRLGGRFDVVTPAEAMLGTGERFAYSVAAEFENQLEYFYDFYSFRGDSGRSALTVAFVIPTDQLRAFLTDSAVVYGVRVSAMVVDTLTREVARVDTMQYYRSARAVPPESYLRTYVQLPVRPSEHSVYRLIVRDAAAPGTGALFGGPVEVRSFAGPAVELSDLVVTGSGAGRWTRGETVLPLTPASAFVSGEPLTLFYEIYNLGPDVPYRTEIQLRPEDPGLMDRVLGVLRPGSRSLRLSFDAVTPSGADAGAVQEVRTLSADLRPDRYRLTITVTDLGTGEQARSSRMVTLAEEE